MGSRIGTHNVEALRDISMYYRRTQWMAKITLTAECTTEKHAYLLSETPKYRYIIMPLSTTLVEAVKTNGTDKLPP